MVTRNFKCEIFEEYSKHFCENVGKIWNNLKKIMGKNWND